MPTLELTPSGIQTLLKALEFTAQQQASISRMHANRGGVSGRISEEAARVFYEHARDFSAACLVTKKVIENQI